MALLACCLYLLLIVLVGYTLLSVIHPSSRMTIVQLIGLGPAVGAGTMGLLLFWASLIGFAPSRKVLAIIGVLTLASLLVMKKKNRLAQIKILATDWEKGDGWIVVPLVVTLAGLAMIATGALSSPLVEWDAFAIWGFKAKVLTHEALRLTPAYFHDLTLSYSHLDYPLMVPFLTSGAYAAMGTVDDQTGKLVSAFLDVLIVPMVYLGLRWKLRRLPAACLSAILAMLPVMFRYAGVGCADLLLAMFYAGSILYVARWIDRQQWPDLILAILFSAFGAFTKNEGVVLALMNGAVILGFGLWGRRRRDSGWGRGVFHGAAGAGCGMVDLEPGPAAHTRRLRIEIIVIGFGGTFAKIERNYPGNAGANNRIPGLGSVVDHGGGAGAVGLAGVDAAICAGPVDFAGIATDVLCAGIQCDTVGPHHADAHDHGPVTVAYGSGGHFSGRLALG